MFCQKTVDVFGYMAYIYVGCIYWMHIPVGKYPWVMLDQVWSMLDLSLRFSSRPSCDDYVWVKLVLTLLLQRGQV